MRAEMESTEWAQSVAHAFATHTRVRTAAQRRDQTEETLVLFQQQERDLLRQIADLETEIKTFCEANDLTRDGGIDFKLAEVANLNEALLDLDSAIIASELDRTQIDISDRALTIARAELEIERELSNFDCRMTKLQSQYDLISTRRSEAQVGFSLEVAARGERLITLEEAQVPDYSPPEKNCAILGGVASIVAAFVFGWLLELRRPVIRRARQMEHETGVTPGVSIPETDTAPVTGKQGGRNARAAAGTA